MPKATTTKMSSKAKGKQRELPSRVRQVQVQRQELEIEADELAGLGRHTTTILVPCNICGKEYKGFGIVTHMKACARKLEQAQIYAERNANRAAMEGTPKRGRHTRQPDPEIFLPSTPLFGRDTMVEGSSVLMEDAFGEVAPLSPIPSIILENSSPRGNVEDEPHPHNEAGPSNPARSSNPEPAPPSNPATRQRYGPLTDEARQRTPQMDDIKVEYHYSAASPGVIYPFDSFVRDMAEDEAEPVGQPWAPFDSRADFEFAELAHEAHLNKRQVKRLLKLINKLVSKRDRLTFKSPKDVDRAWEKAKLRYPTFSPSDFVVTYQKRDHEFTLHSRSLWDWILLQVQDPQLASHFHWDAQRLSKHDGSKWVRFYDEPWTADKFAQVQDSITVKNAKAKPLAIILWADTSKISTFGTQKGHFIVARIGNLPQHVRNGGFLGGGRIVGFLPIIDDDPAHAGKPRYVDFKNAVFHEAFRLFLKDVASLSETGYEVLCGDQVVRVLFPYIHLISADYEEQVVFALNRGLKGLFPCTVCRIPQDQLSDILGEYGLRASAEAEAIVNGSGNIGSKRAATKAIGMRNVKNGFWGIANTDIHEAMSFDRLHAYILGLWQKHLFDEFKKIVKDLAREVSVHIETLVKAFPRWSKLAHFSAGIIKLDFGDGNKWEDVAKIIIHVAYEVLTEEDSPKGYALLCLIRRWQELNMLLSFTVQTETSLAAFAASLTRFQHALERYKRERMFDESPKDWNFIKVHSHTHVPRDVRLKGVLSNMDTKPNEKLNAAMRKAYQLQTNFKNVEVQLGRLEDRSMVAGSIRAQITALDIHEKELRANADPEQGPEEDEGERKAAAWTFNSIYLGSRLPRVSIATFIAQCSGDPAFVNFVPKLQSCMQDIVAREYMDACESSGNLLQELPSSLIPRVSDRDLITECRYAKISYENCVDWRVSIDPVRCNPAFHGAPRYDFAIGHWTHAGVLTPIICKLVRFFVYSANDKKYALALVQPMDEPVSSRPGDSDLGLCRVRPRARDQSMIVSARSLIRGAVVTKDGTRDEYTVMDTVDSDMYVRLMKMFPARNMEYL